jgi:purine-binding chemotaxis protein CheW
MTAATTNRIDWASLRRQLPEMQSALERSATIGDSQLCEIRRARAERLAAGRPSARSATDVLSIFVFKLGEESYGVELRHVVRVFPQTNVTPVPGGATALLGIANLQGEVRSVLDLRRLLSLPDGGSEADGYVLLLRRAGGMVGLRVEQLSEVRHVARAEVTAADSNSDELVTRHARGMTLDKVILLDVEALLEPPADRSQAEHST